MAYVSPNFKTKKSLKEALAMYNEAQGYIPIRVYQPGLGEVPDNGTISLEGPHYPAPHTWYAVGTMKDGKLVSVK